MVVLGNDKQSEQSREGRLKITRMQLCVPLPPEKSHSRSLQPLTNLIGSATLPFVIPSEAEGSAVQRTRPGNMFGRARNRIVRTPLRSETEASSLPERSEVEGPAVPPSH